MLWFDEGKDTGTYTAQFALGQNTNAFGFNISGWQPDAGAMGTTITLLNDGSIADEFFMPASAVTFYNGFIGVVSSLEFDEVRVLIPQIELGPDTSADTIGVDDVSWVVPAPGTGAMVALGALLGTRRRR